MHMDAYVFHKKMEKPQGRFSRAWARTGRKNEFCQSIKKDFLTILSKSRKGNFD